MKNWLWSIIKLIFKKSLCQDIYDIKRDLVENFQSIAEANNTSLDEMMKNTVKKVEKYDERKDLLDQQIPEAMTLLSKIYSTEKGKIDEACIRAKNEINRHKSKRKIIERKANSMAAAVENVRQILF